MRQIHGTKAFENVTGLLLCGFDDVLGPDLSVPMENEETDQTRLAAAIGQLPDLEDLAFVSCDIVYGKFLEYLPKTLRSLEINNCHGLTSDMLQTYLASCSPS